MNIGVGIFLMAVGAILTFAVNVTISGLDIAVIGVVLMVAGLVELVLELFLFAPRRRQRYVYQRQPDVEVYDNIPANNVPPAGRVRRHVTTTEDRSFR
jgi:hypothetical protein